MNIAVLTSDGAVWIYRLSEAMHDIISKKIDSKDDTEIIEYFLSVPNLYSLGDINWSVVDEVNIHRKCNVKLNLGFGEY